MITQKYVVISIHVQVYVNTKRGERKRERMS